MSRQDFIDQLRDLGCDITDQGDRLSFAYRVPVGKFLGKDVKLGFAGGDDFPLNPPSGPHISPRLLPLNNQSGEHPSGAVHESPFGPDWEYWSRPFTGWNSTDHSAKAYMAHIRHLFATQ